MSDKFERGFVALSRDLIDSSLWNLPPDNFRIAVYLLLKARYNKRPHKLPDGTEIKRGQLVTSMTGIAENCCYYENRTTREYSRKKVLSILINLESVGFIYRNSHRKGTHITICNYDSYQDLDKYNLHKRETQREHRGNTEGTQRDTNKKDKNVDNDKKETKKAIALRVSNFFNSNRGSMPECKMMTDRRIKAITARISDYGENSVCELITKATESNFLQGKTDAGFKCGIDWIMNPSNYVKIAEGNYENKANHSTSSPHLKVSRSSNPEDFML